MKSVKQNIILQNTDRHGIALIGSKQRFTTEQRRLRLALDGYYKTTDLARHRLRGHPGLSVLTSLLVSVDVKLY